MKGIIFNLVEDVVVDGHGEQTWDDLLDSAGLSGAYTSMGRYPDDDLHRLVAAGSQALAVPPAVLLQEIGRQTMPRLAERYPAFFAPYDTTLPFLLSLNDVIHAEVCKIHPDATPPRFTFDTSDPDVLLLGYDSPRMLCALAAGMVAGAAEQFAEVATVEHASCRRDGADRCLLHCSFTPAGAT